MKVTKKTSEKPTAKTLKISEISELVNLAEARKQNLIKLLIEYTQDSLPIHFTEHLKLVISELLTKGHYAHQYRSEDFGFVDHNHFRHQIEFLKNTWEGIIRISFQAPINGSFAGFLSYEIAE
ncbi:MAG: hypothetical protein NT148_02110 [Candidatus Nealsonbacteria bacterium]|nr:hypothetical protein [Candidatus Nealsonbacteria bacterium]